jgi:hypothetical protein
MAKATVGTVSKTVTTEVEEEVIQLTLSKVEARALHALTQFVYGNRSATYNREISDVRKELHAAGGRGAIAARSYFDESSWGGIEAKSHLPGDN